MNEENALVEEGQPRFSYYTSLFQLRTEKVIDLEQLYRLLTGSQLRHITGEIRRYAAEGNRKKTEQLKMQLPAIAVSCLFPAERRTEQAGSYTSYALVDVDELSVSADTYRQQCALLPFVTLAHVSGRGGGVHLLIKVNTGVGDHIAACRSLFDMLESALGQKVDRNCTDLVRAALLCYDPDCYYNPEATVWHVPESYLTPALAAEVKHTRAYQAWQGEQLPAGECLSRYLDEAAHTLSMQKGQRHSTLVSLAYSLNRAGFDERMVLSECIRRYAEPDFDQKEITKIIVSAYTSGKAEHGCNRREASARSACSAPSFSPCGEKEGMGLDGIQLEHAKSATKCFPSALYEHLPDMLSDMFIEGLTEVERSVALLGSLGIFSCALPNVTGSYQNSEYAPPLYTCIVGAPGTGKGMLSRIRPVYHKYAAYVRNRSAKEVKEYQKAKLRYDLELSNFSRGKTDKLSDEPEEVKYKELELSGDITRPRLVELIEANKDIAALMYENEIDVLNVAISQEHGKFRDVMNRIYQHEQISKDTKRDKRSNHNSPRMGVVISGTPAQAVRFAFSTEDGLFSRLLCFYITEPSKWKNLTSSDDTPHRANYYKGMGDRLLKIALHLEAYPTWINYTEDQREKMNEMFSAQLERIRSFAEGDMSGIIFRLGLTHFRISMVLTAIRKGEQRLIDRDMLISDKDFDTATGIIFHCLDHILVLSSLLKKDTTCNSVAYPVISERLYTSLTDSFTTAEASASGKELGMSQRSIESALTKWCRQGLSARISNGCYKKKSLKKSK